MMIIAPHGCAGFFFARESPRYCYNAAALQFKRYKNGYKSNTYHRASCR